MLLVINGAPGIGKSTLARRYVGESRIVARALALDLMRSQLSGGRDVVVPQFLGRPQYLTEMSDVAAAVGNAFVEVCLACAHASLIDRFRKRRIQYARGSVEHPRSDLDDTSVVAELGRSNDQLVGDARSRGSVIVPIDGDVEESLDCLRAAVGTVTG